MSGGIAHKDYSSRILVDLCFRKCVKVTEGHASVPVLVTELSFASSNEYVLSTLLDGKIPSRQICRKQPCGESAARLQALSESDFWSRNKIPVSGEVSNRKILLSTGAARVLCYRLHSELVLMVRLDDSSLDLEFAFSLIVKVHVFALLYGFGFTTCYFGLLSLARTASKRNWDSAKQVLLAAVTMQIFPGLIFAHLACRSIDLDRVDLIPTSDRFSIAKLFTTDPDEALR